MAHKIYDNLAHFDTFPSDLNYTGIVTDGWNSPVNMVPVVLLISLLVQGLPHGFLSLWVLINCCFIHPWMDGIIGAFGVGPKYLVDEYAVVDTRYWPLQDPCVTVISLTELLIMAPLCFFWYRAIVKNLWYKHYCGLLASAFQQMGTFLYVICEIMEGLKHLPGVDSLTAPKFDSYIKLKYFWFVFVFLNSLWILIPTYVYIKYFQEMKKDFEGRKKEKDIKKKK